MSFRWRAADVTPIKPALLTAAFVDNSRSQPAKKRQRDGEARGVDEQEDEGFGPEDDADLELDADEDDERIGLDTSTGFDEPGDDLDLDRDEDEDEDERWSVDSEEAGDLPDAEPDSFPGEEYGWIGEDEPAADDDDSFDADLDDEDTEPGDDGAEGVDDESDLDDLELSELPELDADAEEDPGAALEGLDDLGTLALIDEPSLEISAGELWKMLPARAVRITRIAAPAQAISSLVAHGGSLYLAAAGLYRLGPEATQLTSLQLPAAGAPSCLALAELDGELHLAAVAGGRIYVSRDAGQHFQERPQSAVLRAYYTRSASGLRLWWRTTRGELCSDQGQGSLLAPELDGELQGICADGKRSIALLVKREGRLALLTSTDAGKRFSRHPLPPSAAAGGASPELQVCRDAVLLVSDTGPLCALLPGAFEPIATLARAPAALSDEEDEPFVYACAPRGDEWLLIRRAAAARSSAPLVVAAFARDLLQDPQRLAVGYREGGALVAFLAGVTAGEHALLRIEASLDGEELA